MKYNPNSHHRRSIRLKGYDYSKAGLYFITICCCNRECFFGEITKIGTEQIMSLNKSGSVVEDGWLEIPLHYPEVVLHEFVVMPNHIHGIIEIIDFVGANIDSPLQMNYTKFRSPSKTLGSILRGFKIGVTKWHRANTDIYKVWQRSYHDHVIRNERSHATISNYILNNPSTWDDDRFFTP